MLHEFSDLSYDSNEKSFSTIFRGPSEKIKLVQLKVFSMIFKKFLGTNFETPYFLGHGKF